MIGVRTSYEGFQAWLRALRRPARAGAAALACLLAAGVLATGCASDDATAGHHAHAAARVMRFNLDSQQGGALAVTVPDEPKATVSTNTADLDFELYVLRRSNKVVDVVFALHNTGQSDIALEDPTEKLDESPAIAVHVASAIALVDTKGLKEYKTFRENGDEGKCLCSQTWNVVGDGSLPAGKRRYYAAEVAAPPTDVTQVTVKAGLTDVNRARIDQ